VAVDAVGHADVGEEECDFGAVVVPDL
jgi:hypothetical protein